MSRALILSFRSISRAHALGPGLGPEEAALQRSVAGLTPSSAITSAMFRA